MKNEKSKDEIFIRPLTENDIVALAVDHCLPHATADESLKKWNKYYEDQKIGIRTIGIVQKGEKLLGYGSLLFNSDYSHFNDIPEIHDVWIYKEYRKKGLGSLLIAWLEELAKNHRYKNVGIGVGLYEDYGSAQRLYVQLGYIPDGHGITYKYQKIVAGEVYPLDDDLILWLKKDL